MGYGNYSLDAHRSLIAGRSHRSASEVFRQSECHALMNPKGLKVRESRDSGEHPEALAIVFALDVTGSMGSIPRLLAQQELPNFMKLINACGIADPQILFMAVGDDTSDRAPLQVGQFESTAELMDQWLTWSYLEGGGGGTGQESYELAFYIAAQHTDTDNWVKRKKKGYLILTGDERPYPAVSRHQVEALVGEKLDEDIPIEEVIAAAAETYHLFYLIPDAGRRGNCEARWRELLGDHVICLEDPVDTCPVAAAIVGMTEGKIPDIPSLHAILEGSGLDQKHIASSIRAIERYANVLHVPGTYSPPAGAKITKWWKGLFD
jgi:hypothetical protein